GDAVDQARPGGAGWGGARLFPTHRWNGGWRRRCLLFFENIFGDCRNLKYSSKQERALMLDLWRPDLADDLLKFVLYVYPWQQAGTPLASVKGPRKWQADDLDEISQHIKNNKGRIALDQIPEVFQKSTVSGRGSGKSAEVSWLVWWFMTTRLGSTTIVTANGEPQLRSRTWPEIGKWATLALNSHWFDYQATSLRPAPWFAESVKKDLKIDTGYYYAQAQLWREETPDAFAGAHNMHGLLLLMDEASGIPGAIWTVCEGFFTEPIMDRLWLVFSNGRRNSGAFYDTHHKFAQMWRRRCIDARAVEGTDPDRYQKIIEMHGADSDEARVEVYGQFPNQGDMQFIPAEYVHGAQRRDVVYDQGAALVMGVDLSRGRVDKSVIRFRQGRDARTIPPRRCMERDATVVAEWIAQAIDDEDPDCVNIDGGDLGGAICDILKSRKYRVNEVLFGSSSSDPQWDDKATEMWAEIKSWLPSGAIDNDPALETDLISREKRRVGKANERIRLESKEDLRERGLSSPDNGDALALTFATKVARRDARAAGRRHGRSRVRLADGVEEHQFGE
ncbi:MAG: hypothetical protein U1E51_25135, partial [Candidatus Binatia bacterium]|nr:hypothetical protein [Candidatus Binatia bacterium]